MYFSAHWLARYVELPDSIDELADLLTRCGMVVDDRRPHGADTVFDLDIPTNRVDAMNHVGVAREIATARRVDLALPEAAAAESGPPIEELTSVRVDDYEGCPRYCARLIRGVKVAPSPPWMVALLEAIGLRPLNNVADITNFVLWELGHPLHAFDFDKLGEQRIVVRRAHDGEHLVTLDDVGRTLGATDVVIADADRPVALAGIMGGAESAISDGSTNVLLEGAWFDPAAVRATAQRLNMHTDASHRFERSPACDGMLAALDRAAALIVEMAGGELAPGTLDVRGELPAPTQTVLRRDRLAGLLGIDVASEDIEDILTRLGFAVQADGDAYRVGVPSFRPDVTREEDLIEEVGRHIGYDRLPATLPVIRAVQERATPEVLGERRLKRCMSAFGCHEAMSSSLSSTAEQAPFLPDGAEAVAIANPISESLGVLRAHIAPGLLAAVAHNVNHGQTALRLFEVGRCFNGPLTDDGLSERWGLGIVLCGERRPSHWEESGGVVDFFDLKGIVDGVTRQMAWPAWQWSVGEAPALAADATALLQCSDDDIAAHGWAGKVAADTAARFGIDMDVWIAELDVDALLDRPHPTAQYQPVSRYPGGVRDVALVVPHQVTWSNIHDTARQAAQSAQLPLAGISLVEIYEGEEIPADSRGMTVRFLFRADDHTLTADEIDAGQGLLIDALGKNCGARQR
ncbi:MAG: phenylalanine--tRNA ligase subunit beta [Acidobacteriota bacterium]|jgi:phenylalanyl-tRNA synthetase beta chain